MEKGIRVPALTLKSVEDQKEDPQLHGAAWCSLGLNFCTLKSRHLLKLPCDFQH